MTTRKKTGAPGQAAASPARPLTPAELLPLLAGWMADNGLEPEHPWQFAISKTLAAAADATASIGERTANPEPLFRPFEWIEPDFLGSVPSFRATDLAGRAVDVAEGVAVLLQMFERDAIDEDCCDADNKPFPPLLGKGHRGGLMRLAVASLRMLAADSTKLIEQVRSERGRSASATGGNP